MRQDHRQHQEGRSAFNRPTDVAVAPDGELYVCDGYATPGSIAQGGRHPDPVLGRARIGPASSPAGTVSRFAGRPRLRDRPRERPDPPLHPDVPTPRHVDPCPAADGHRLRKGRYVYVSSCVAGGQSSFVATASSGSAGRVSIFDLKGTSSRRMAAAPTEEAAAGNLRAPHTLCLDSPAGTCTLERDPHLGRLRARRCRRERSHVRRIRPL